MLRKLTTNPDSAILDGLAESALFHDLPAEALREIALITTVMPIYPGQTLLEEGDTGSDFMVITRGEIRLKVESIYPALEIGIHRAGPGDFLGEHALLGGEDSPVTAVCALAGTILRVKAPALERILGRNPDWGYPVLRRLAEGLIERNRRMARRFVSKARFEAM